MNIKEYIDAYVLLLRQAGGQDVVQAGPPPTPMRVKAALDHVRHYHPDTMVVFGHDGRWLYMTDDFYTPKFGPDIDVSILEAAADSLTHLPAIFSAHEPKQML